MKDVIVTKHAKERVKQRIGLPKKAIQSMAQKAFDHGTEHSEAKGRLKRWMSKLFHEYRTANNTRIYGKHVYLFSGLTLITVLHLPHSMEGAARKSEKPPSSPGDF